MIARVLAFLTLSLLASTAAGQEASERHYDSRSPVRDGIEARIDQKRPITLSEAHNLTPQELALRLFGDSAPIVVGKQVVTIRPYLGYIELYSSYQPMSPGLCRSMRYRVYFERVDGNAPLEAIEYVVSATTSSEAVLQVGPLREFPELLSLEEPGRTQDLMGQTSAACSQADPAMAPL